MKRSRKRTLLMLLLLLTGGAIINVAVAWGGFMNNKWTPDPQRIDGQFASRFWSTWAPKDWTFSGLGVIEYRAWNWTWTLASGSRVAHPSSTLDVVRVIVFLQGWPARSLFAISNGSDGSRWIGLTECADARFRTQLATIPIWPGFAINTLFYTAVLWLLVAAPGKLRRFARTRHGQCTRCGYDLRGQTETSANKTCPECGKNAK